MSKVIEINNLSKVYDLGLVGTGTLYKDLNRTWAKLRGKPDPYATLVELNDRTQKSSSNMVYALKDINFSVEQGEVLGIIGKNGAGKSTLLKILSQITSPSAGAIKMKGRVASLLEVGTGMHPEMTAKQNIYLNGSLMGMRRNEITSKLDEIIDFAGVQKYIDTPVKRYSSGMKVRLAFAVAAHLEPDILIVDEVLAVGDAEFQKKAIGKMHDISTEGGRTVLFVSHNMAAVEDLCSRAILLEDGLFTFQGGVTEVITKYLTSDSLKEGCISFDKIKDKSVKGALREFAMLNTKNEIETRFLSSDTLKFKFSLNIKTRLNFPVITLRISDMNNVNIINWRSNNYIESPLPKNVEEDFIVELECSSLYLLNGIYFVSVGFADGKEVISVYDKFFQFEVQASKPTNEYFNITKENSTNSVVFYPAKWNVYEKTN